MQKGVTGQVTGHKASECPQPPAVMITFDNKDLTWHTFFVFLLPLIFAYGTAALLVLSCQRRLLRSVFLPFSLWITYRFVTSVKIGRQGDPRYDYWNHGNLVCLPLFDVYPRLYIPSSWSARLSSAL